MNDIISGSNGSCGTYLCTGLPTYDGPTGLGTPNSTSAFVGGLSVSAISPTSGPAAGGTSVTISGTNFATGATVTFAGIAASNIAVVSSTTITATTPTGSIGKADVVVTNPNNGQSGTLAGGYTYLGPAPTVGSIIPTSGPIGGGTSVTISGTNFTPAAAVSVGSVAATNVAVASSTSLTATTPADTAGTVDVTVTNPDGQIATLTGGFSYIGPDFSVQFGPQQPSPVSSGSNATYAIGLTASGGYNANVTFSASGLPRQTNATFSPNPAAWPAGSSAASTTLTVTTKFKAPGGTYPLTITATGADGTKHTTTATLVIQ